MAVVRISKGVAHGLGLAAVEALVDVGAPGRIRTCGTRFRRAVLYPLSYGGPKAA